MKLEIGLFFFLVVLAIGAYLYISKSLAPTQANYPIEIKHISDPLKDWSIQDYYSHLEGKG